MRMWMVDPKTMCRDHLLGEHVEIHMLVGAINKGKKLDGFVKNNLIQIRSLKDRHDHIAFEMALRGYKHASNLMFPQDELFKYSNEVAFSKVDKEQSLKDLHTRCPECKQRWDKEKENSKNDE